MLKKRIPTLKTSPVCVPLRGGAGSLSSSGDVQNSAVKQPYNDWTVSCTSLIYCVSHLNIGRKHPESANCHVAMYLHCWLIANTGERRNYDAISYGLVFAKIRQCARWSRVPVHKIGVCLLPFRYWLLEQSRNNWRYQATLMVVALHRHDIMIQMTRICLNLNTVGLSLSYRIIMLKWTNDPRWFLEQKLSSITVWIVLKCGSSPPQKRMLPS